MNKLRSIIAITRLNRPIGIYLLIYPSLIAFIFASQLLTNAENIAKQYHVHLSPPPLNVKFIDENDSIQLGETLWQVIFTPGHAPGHICLFNKSYNKIIAGDVLFYMSIGRTDLPLCNHEDLMNSIKRLFTK